MISMTMAILKIGFILTKKFGNFKSDLNLILISDLGFFTLKTLATCYCVTIYDERGEF